LTLGQHRAKLQIFFFLSSW